jgi:hypothetical protein
MIKSVQATPERGDGCAQRGCVAATLLLRLFALGWFWLWPLVRADGQSFGINHIDDRSISVNTTLAIQVSVTDSNIPPSQLNFTLASNRPNTDADNASISLNYGGFAWTPTQAQVVTFTVTATSLPSGYQTSTNFTVNVTNAVPPAGGVVIDPIPSQTVAEGTLLTFTSTAHATDNPNSLLVFRLLNPPAGASITNNSLTSGVFTWTPTAAQAATPFYTIREIVTEPSTSASNYQDFQVTVTLTNDCSQFSDFLAAVAQGGYFLLTNCSTIVLTDTLTISKSLILDGGSSGVTIAGNNLVRLFTVLPGANLTLYGLTLQGGSNANGGAIYISPGGGVMMTNCILVGNSAVGTNGTAGTAGSGGGNIGKNGGNGTAGIPGLGGAIYNLGRLTNVGCQFLTNRVAGGSGGSGGNGGDGTFQGGNGGNGGAGALGYGGAMYNQGVLWLTNCTFAGNTATGGNGGSGGAMGGGAFDGNAGSGGTGAGGFGAAVYSEQSVIAVNCTFSANVAQSGNSAAGGTGSSGNGVNGPRGPDSLGGGIYVQGFGALTNCTFANNTVTGGNGGNGGDAAVAGIHIAGNGGNGGNGVGGGLYNTGAVVVANCTFSSCGAIGGTNGVGGSGPSSSDGSPGHGRGGDIAQGSGTFILRNTILGASSAGTNAYDTGASRITDGGYNLSSDASLNLSGTSRKNTDPLLGLLAYNGGLTQTIAVQSNSPAINKIPLAMSPATDQRGIPRPQPQGGLSDIGAYELATLPVILTQPQSQTLAQGSNATFTVFAFTNSPTYQWRFNGTNISGATDSSYTTNSVGIDNAGDYDVVLINSYGSVTSAVASLTVLEPPEITTQPTDLSVLQGSNATFTVQATGLEPLYYQWQFNGTNISAANESSYPVISAQPSNAGSYTVVITNAHGRVTSAPAVLTVDVSPSITVQPADQTVVSGTNATFMVTATGTSPLSYQWRFNGANISGATSSVTTINSIKTDDAGNYDVIVTNSFGTITSLMARLTVVVPLPFTISGRITSGSAGLVGVKVTAASATNSGITDFNGYYTISGLPTNTYTVTPSLACFRFSPSNQVVHVGPDNTNNVNFSASSDFHLISGRVIEYTNGLSNVMITVTVDGETNSVTTSSNGYFTISGLCSNTYSVTPSLRCYRFNPASQSLQLGADTTNVNFIAGRLAYTISGSTSNGSEGLSDVRVTIGDAYGTNTVISTNGSYSVSGLCPGTYSVTPSRAGFAFDPGSTNITVGPDAATVNFLATPLFNISGRVTEGSNAVSGVSVKAESNTGTTNTTTDAYGNYTFSAVRAGPVIITPSLDCYRFNPTIRPFTVSSNTTEVSFDAIHGFTIRGQINVGSNGLSGVTVSAGGKSTVTTNGSYTLSGLCSNTYSVTPSLSGYQFEPGTTNVTLSSTDYNGVNFAAFAIFSISGHIREGTNGLGGVNLGVGTNTTGPDGSYTISGLRAGTNILTPSLGCYHFDPTNRVVIVGPSTNNQNFIASLSLYTISGRITEGARGLSGVAVQIGDTTIGTDVNGYYALSGLCPGTYPVIPSFPGYQFEPGTNNVTLSSTDSNGVDFAAYAVFNISGRISEGTNGLAGVNLGIGTNSTGPDGSYTISSVRAGPIIIAPSLDCYWFSPTTREFYVESDSNGVDFAATHGFTIRGQITVGSNGLSGVTVSAGGRSTVTTNGNYALSGLCSNTYTVSPSLHGYAFAPSAQSVVVLSNMTLPAFMAFPSLAIVRVGDGAFQLAFTPAFKLQVQASTDLKNWDTPFTTNNVSTNTVLLQFTDTNATNLPMRFYRVGQTFAGSPALTNWIATDHSVSLGCVAAPVLACQIEASTNLTSWVAIFSSNLPAAAPFQFRYAETTNSPVRFYRLSQTPGF